jgi:transketolase
MTENAVKTIAGMAGAGVAIGVGLGVANAVMGQIKYKQPKKKKYATRIKELISKYEEPKVKKF